MAPVIRLNWCKACGGGRNFGDQLGPLLLRHYGYQVVWAPPRACRVIAVGSILSKVPDGYRGTVLGTGFIKAGIRRDLSRARVLAVRGALTRDACGLSAGTMLGDLGMLVVDLPRTAFPRCDALVVPHTVDHELVERHPGAAVATATWPPGNLLGAIANAGLVVTSSLHVLIAADAFGIPHVLEPHPDVIGGMFKFRDYASAFGLGIEPGVERLTSRDLMAERQAELRALVGRLA